MALWHPKTDAKTWSNSHSRELVRVLRNLKHLRVVAESTSELHVGGWDQVSCLLYDAEKAVEAGADELWKKGKLLW